MTKTEMNRRLALLTPDLIAQGKRMIREGYGALGISQNSPLTLKQANALFQKVRDESSHSQVRS